MFSKLCFEIFDQCISDYHLENSIKGKSKNPYEKKDIKLTVENNILKISTRNGEEEEKTNYTLRERKSYQTERCFTLPDSVIPKKISARFKNGMLLLNIPKAENKKEAVNNIKIN